MHPGVNKFIQDIKVTLSFEGKKCFYICRKHTHTHTHTQQELCLNLDITQSQG